MVLIVVEPIDHGRAFCDFHENFLVVPEAFVAEHVYHVLDLIVVVHFGNTSCENVVVKEAKFFL